VGDDVEAVEGKANVDFSGELVADAAGIASGRSHAEEFFTFEEQDLAGAALGQVIRGARAMNPRDDDGIGGLRHHMAVPPRG